MTVLRQSTALLAICAVLVVITASALPGHGHQNDTTRSCDICHSGHLPCLQPSGEIQLYAHTPVTWQLTSSDVECRLDSALVTQSPRAPPV